MLKISLYKKDCIDIFTTNAKGTTNNLLTNPAHVRIEDVPVISFL